MPVSASPLELRVAVLARDPETLDGLTDYLRAAGARALPRRDLLLDEGAEVIVLFGDDFDTEASAAFVRDWMGDVARQCVLILVTSSGALADRTRCDPRAAVLRRPVWGWVLLAAIQSGLRTAARLASPAEPQPLEPGADVAT